ncbi:GNAT family N-acetyltransferase [Desulfotruncus alcoholivorax]|uniref:GNAT family N-acetyltransferase n=1 Tax=Desulfotruncus alcoholivorax TaxID=265477 RepID=UPI000405DA8A|nr:GNAT family N-acetyltransferase [Desulfotruncus alcoholivorax]
MKPKIIKVASFAEKQAFLNVPSLVYGRESVPPAVNSFNTSMRFDPMSNPTLQHLKYANFVAIMNGKPVGRISATIDNLNPRNWEGFWGCFECIENVDVAGALIDAAAGWLKEQGKTEMIGPATLNSNQQVGILIKGFEQEAGDELPYNPPYYQKIVEGAGLEKIHELDSFKWELPKALPEKLTREIDLPGLVVRPVNYANFIKEAGIMQEINNRAMTEIFGFIPMTLQEAQSFLMGLSTHVPPSCFLIAEVNGKPAAMLISIPYIRPARDKDGYIRLAIGGVIPEFRQKGIPKAILKAMYNNYRKLGYTRGEASQVASSNNDIKSKILKPLMGAEIIKTHRVYKKKL